MKRYNNFCITWQENRVKHETVHFCKVDAVREYINLLFARVDSGREISSLSFYGVTIRGYNLEDLTGCVNRFLNN